MAKTMQKKHKSSKKKSTCIVKKRHLHITLDKVWKEKVVRSVEREMVLAEEEKE